MTPLKVSAMVLTLQACQTKVSKRPLSGFVVSSLEGDNLPNAWIKEEIDPNVYKIIERMLMTSKIQPS